jgi:hypothetical protein
MRLRRRTRALVAVTVAAAAFAMAGPVQPASAAPAPISLSGTATSHLGWLINADVEFPATFDGTVDLATQAIEGEMTTGGGTLSFNALGLLPATTGVQLEFTEPVTGTVDLSTLAVEVSTTFEVHLTSFKLFGLEGLTDPSLDCRAEAPVTTTLTGTFNATTGIALDGTYAIGKFVDCGFWTDWITLFTSASGHTIHAELAP